MLKEMLRKMIKKINGKMIEKILKKVINATEKKVKKSWWIELIEKKLWKRNWKKCR